MTTVTAKDAKNRFGELLDTAQRAPVYITKNGKKVAVVLSQEEYELFQNMEDAIWAARAERAKKEGTFLGPKESEAFLRKLVV